MDLEEMRRLRAVKLNESCGRLMESSASLTPAGVSMLKRAVPLLAEEIDKYLKVHARTRGVKPTAYAWLKRLPAEVSALIASRCILDTIAMTVSFNHVCLVVGRLITDEAGLRDALREAAPEVSGRIKKIARNRASRGRRRKLAKEEARLGGITFAERREAIQVGVSLVHLFIQSTGLVEVKTVARPRRGNERGPRQSNKIVAAEGVLDWIRQFHEKIPAMMPVFMPMSEPPADWHPGTVGGYGPGAGRGTALISRGEPEQVKAIREGQGADAVRALNLIQAVPWSIDTDVLEVAKAIWAEGHGVGGLPKREPIPMPPKPDPWVDKSPEVISWSRQAAGIATANDTAKSRAVAVAKVLWAAERMQQAGRFWFPMQFDFRGRMYPKPGSLQPQGCDLSRGLLRFADGRPMGSNEDSEKWLKIHGANCFGIDKVSFAERLQWVADNEQRVLAVGENPLEDRFWTEADSPWQFLAFCLEWWRYKQVGPSYVTTLPVAVDGSNNGLQLYALLTGSLALAKATNVVPSDRPQDIYAEVAQRATVALKETALLSDDRGLGASWALSALYPAGLPRKLVKRSVMTLPYGVSRYSSARYVAEFIRDDCASRGIAMPVGSNHYAMLSAVSEAVWSVIKDYVGPAVDCMKWLRDCAALCAKAEKPMTWLAPNGFPVVMRYHRSEMRRVKTVLGDAARVGSPKARFINIEAPLDGLSPSRMAAGSAPNFVHSLDASVLTFAVLRAASVGVSSLSVIHDSYSAPAPDMAALGAAIRQSVLDVFSTDPLERLRQSVVETTAEEVEPYQLLNQFDRRAIVSSEYFFA